MVRLEQQNCPILFVNVMIGLMMMMLPYLHRISVDFNRSCFHRPQVYVSCLGRALFRVEKAFRERVLADPYDWSKTMGAAAPYDNPGRFPPQIRLLLACALRNLRRLDEQQVYSTSRMDLWEVIHLFENIHPGAAKLLCEQFDALPDEVSAALYMAGCKEGAGV